ncbi:MAG: penicillin acylase family protein, partial [Myxococcota bacterium]
MRQRWWRVCALGVVAVLGSCVGCALVVTRPAERTTQERDAMFLSAGAGLSAPVTVRWNEHRIPFIEAERDEDLAFALGAVHAHLRWSQLEYFRMISQGRLSELVGPLAVDVDRTIRILSVDMAVDEIIARMPRDTKVWVQRFLDGLNAQIERMSQERRPADLRVLGIRPEPWTMRELVGLWRLASLDVNWGTLVQFLNLSKQPGWEVAWEEYVARGGAGTPSFDAQALRVNPALVFEGMTKSGSNSLVIAGARTQSGAALMANDPHLGTQLPNFWVLVGYRSPSHHAVGFMIPGVPFVAVGRNPEVAWGGTNMRGLSTYLYELDAETVERAEVIEQTIKVRGWRDQTVRIRRTEFGPILTDAPFFAGSKDVAIRWVGQDPSDEVTAFLMANRARSFEEFRRAFRTYAVSAQNMLYADAQGNIGHVLAMKQPIRREQGPPALLQPTSNPWVRYKRPTELPYAYNPADGFIASANNKPTGADDTIGWFFATSDRVERMAQLVRSVDKVRVEDLAAWQLDVYSASAKRLADAIVSKVEDPGALDPRRRVFFEALASWDGHYTVEARGPVALEALAYELGRRVFRARTQNEEVLGALIAHAHFKATLTEDVLAMDSATFLGLLEEAMDAAMEDFEAYKTWGQMHQITVQHLLGNIPVIGRRYRFETYAVGGGADTLFKRSVRPGKGPLPVTYGAQSRHISDLSDPDANYFVLFGGNDGWLVSPQSTDQMQMWREGR